MNNQMDKLIKYGKRRGARLGVWGEDGYSEEYIRCCVGALLHIRQIKVWCVCDGLCKRVRYVSTWMEKHSFFWVLVKIILLQKLISCYIFLF